MSQLGNLGVDFSNLPNILVEYMDALDKAPEILNIKNKTLEIAHKEQCSWIVYYDERRVELKTLIKYLTLNVNKVRGKLVRHFNENHSRGLGERLINSYIDADNEYIKAQELLLEVEELYEKYAAVVEAFNKRGFALRDITLARVHDVGTSAI